MVDQTTNSQSFHIPGVALLPGELTVLLHSSCPIPPPPPLVTAWTPEQQLKSRKRSYQAAKWGETKQPKWGMELVSGGLHTKHKTQHTHNTHKPGWGVFAGCASASCDVEREGFPAYSQAPGSPAVRDGPSPAAVPMPCCAARAKSGYVC